MATTTVTIPATTIAAGDQVLGPFPVPAGLSKAKLVFDVLALLGTLAVAVDYSPDGGVTWQNISAVSGAGPIPTGTDGKGNPLGNWSMSANLQAPSTANGQVRVGISCSIAFLSAGGSLTVS